MDGYELTQEDGEDKGKSCRVRDVFLQRIKVLNCLFNYLYDDILYIKITAEYYFKFLISAVLK